MAHHCHAMECKVAVPPEMFMCKRHWFMLPKNLRDEIWRTYRAGQCDDWNPSAAYCDAARKCLLFVAAKEGRTVTGQEDALKMYDYFARQATPHPKGGRGA